MNFEAFYALKAVEASKLQDLTEKLNYVVLSLSQIDGNVKGLQERAHVWDTFQLHVSSWNEQIKAVDRKLDLLSRSSSISSARPGFPLELENRLSLLVQKLENGPTGSSQTEDQTASGQQSSLSSSTSSSSSSSSSSSNGAFSRDPLVAEFAAKGVMTTLKSLDSKIDNILRRDHEAENKVFVATVIEELLETGACVAFRPTTSSTAAGSDSDDSDADLTLSGDGETCKRNNSEVQQNVRKLMEMVGDLRSDMMTHLDEDNSGCHSKSKHTFPEDILKASTKLITTEIEAVAKEVSGLRQAVSNTGLMSTSASDATSMGSGSKQKYPSFCVTTWNEMEKRSKFKFSSITNHVEETHKCCYDQTHRFKGFQATTEFKLGQLDEVLRTHEFNDERRLGLIQDHYTRQMAELLNRVDRLSLKLDKNCFGSKDAGKASKIILNESTNYTLIINGYSGNASDSLSAHNGSMFSTYDRTNDRAPECCPCSPAYGSSGWWFYACFESNLTGPYFGENEDNLHFQGIIWEHFKGDYSLKRAEMKVRPRKFKPKQSGSENPSKAPKLDPWWSTIPIAEDP
ncbi:unnamed protein product [Notodromas monacha]|uniref:Fibrinogen C-terminal domain-containing protein n=1 Tax=Notodromas monacha TaxID=399045 RepID=A0A7R9GCL5_9CRUS|nr:unnamed protein product [Notodromas monacha]CAG0915977.1 unnamed protein product [Notodromas monacha]